MSTEKMSKEMKKKKNWSMYTFQVIFFDRFGLRLLEQPERHLDLNFTYNYNCKRYINRPKVLE